MIESFSASRIALRKNGWIILCGTLGESLFMTVTKSIRIMSKERIKVILEFNSPELYLNT